MCGKVTAFFRNIPAVCNKCCALQHYSTFHYAPHPAFHALLPLSCPFLSELQAEFLAFEFIVVFLVEAVEAGLAPGGVPHGFVEFGEQVEVEHLLGKVGAVELHVEYGLVERLHLFHGEHLGQEVEAYGPEMEAFAQHGRGKAQYAVVIESKLRYLVEAEFKL